MKLLTQLGMTITVGVKLKLWTLFVKEMSRKLKEVLKFDICTWFVNKKHLVLVPKVFSLIHVGEIKTRSDILQSVT